jgi:hypothetical protein
MWGCLVVRLERCEALPPPQAIDTVFDVIPCHGLGDREGKGRIPVNPASEMAPHDAEFREMMAGVLMRIEGFCRNASGGQSFAHVTPRIARVSATIADLGGVGSGRCGPEHGGARADASAVSACQLRAMSQENWAMPRSVAKLLKRAPAR